MRITPHSGGFGRFGREKAKKAAIFR